MEEREGSGSRVGSGFFVFGIVGFLFSSAKKEYRARGAALVFWRQKEAPRRQASVWSRGPLRRLLPPRSSPRCRCRCCCRPLLDGPRYPQQAPFFWHLRFCLARARTFYLKNIFMMLRTNEQLFTPLRNGKQRRIASCSKTRRARPGAAQQPPPPPLQRPLARRPKSPPPPPPPPPLAAAAPARRAAACP